VVKKRHYSSETLAKGQLWKTAAGYIHIVDMGTRLISYKLLKQQGQRAVRTQMTGIDSLRTYLRTEAAELVT
jgi:hypothetical protein